MFCFAVSSLPLEQLGLAPLSLIVQELWTLTLNSVGTMKHYCSAEEFRCCCVLIISHEFHFSVPYCHLKPCHLWGKADTLGFLFLHPALILEGPQGVDLVFFLWDFSNVWFACEPSFSQCMSAPGHLVFHITPVSTSVNPVAANRGTVPALMAKLGEQENTGLKHFISHVIELTTS